MYALLSVASSPGVTRPEDRVQDRDGWPGLHRPVWMKPGGGGACTVDPDMRQIDAKRVVAVSTVATALLASVLVFSACGSASSTAAATATTAALEGWAGSLCTAVTSYASELKAVGGTLSGESLSKGALRGAAEELKASTKAFAADVKSLGKPDAVANSAAGRIVQDLTADLKTEADAMRSATQDTGSAEVLSAVSAVSATLVTAKDQVTTAIEQLKQLDPKGELQQAFESADSCSSLTGS
jgi:hypothetical protein